MQIAAAEWRCHKQGPNGDGSDSCEAYPSNMTVQTSRTHASLGVSTERRVIRRSPQLTDTFSSHALTRVFRPCLRFRLACTPRDKLGQAACPSPGPAVRPCRRSHAVRAPIRGNGVPCATYIPTPFLYDDELGDTQEALVYGVLCACVCCTPYYLCSLYFICAVRITLVWSDPF